MSHLAQRDITIKATKTYSEKYFLHPKYLTLCSALNSLTPELNRSAQSCLPILLLGILIFKGLITRRLYKSFGLKELSKRWEKIAFKFTVQERWKRRVT
jgi:hypothetical protein